MYPIITETTITLEEFIKLNETILRQNKAIKRTFIINIIITLFFIITQQYLAAIIFGIFTLFLLYIIKRSLKKQVEKGYQSNKNIQNQKIQYKFYEEYFLATTLNSESKMNYDRLYDIIETKENFYLMESNALAHIIIKKHCNPELTNHIQNLIKQHNNGK